MPAGDYRASIWRPLGYRSYYDYRIHGYGRIPPGVQVGPTERRMYRGHAGLRELLQAINRTARNPDGSRGPFIREIQPNGTERGAGGQWRTIRMDAMLANGQMQRFYLRGRSASHQNLLLVKQALSHPGALHRRGEGEAPRRGEGVGYTAPGRGDEEGDVDTGGPVDYGGEEEEFDHEEGDYLDDYYWDYEDEFDWDIPYGIANSVGEFA